MNAKHRKTLSAIFAQPIPPDIRWTDIEALLRALGADVTEGAGSRVRVILNGTPAIFHRPHPKPVTDKGAVKAVRRFLQSVGVKS